MWVQWALGVLFDPSSTFGKAQREVRFEYLWIWLSVLTLEVVVTAFGPVPNVSVQVSDTLFGVLLILVVLLDVQALLLMGSARLVGTKIPWREALKYVGLAWSVLLAEELVTFYPRLRGQTTVLAWMDLPFLIWYLISLTLGIRKVRGLSLSRAALAATVATLPWWGALYWANFLYSPPTI